MNRTKKILILPVLFVLACTMHAGAQDDLRQINDAAKSSYVKPETLDQLMTRFRTFENKVPAGQETLYMETYRTFASQYAGNNHFKQAYEVFNKYLAYKQSLYASEKTRAIQQAIASVGQRNKSEDQELIELENQGQQLEIDNNHLSGKRSGFKQFFSLGILALSVFFAIVFLRSGIQLGQIRNSWKHNREQMKKQHRLSTIGALATGFIENSLKSIGQIENGTSGITAFLQDQNLLSTPVKNKAKEIRNLVTSLKSNLTGH